MRRRRIPLRPSLRFPSLSEQPGRGSPGRPPRQRGPAVTLSSGDAHGPGVTHSPGSLTAPGRRRPPRAHRADRKRERSAGRRERGARAPSRGRPGTAGVSHRCGGLGRRRSSGERRNAAGSERTGRPRCGKRLQGRGARGGLGAGWLCWLHGCPGTQLRSQAAVLSTAGQGRRSVRGDRGEGSSSGFLPGVTEERW